MTAMSLFLALSFCSSCSKDDVSDANEVEVTFNVNMQGEAGSRAYSDGKTAIHLVFAVFEANGEELPDLRQGMNGEIEFVDLKTTVTTKLAKGKTYDFVFWARPKGCDAFDLTDMRHIKMNYTENNLVCSNETLDAFYHAENDVKITGSKDMNVTLRRPFAQINFGTTEADWTYAKKSGIGENNEIKTRIKVEGGIYTTLNTRDGSVADMIDDELVFELALIPDGENEWIPNVDALKKDEATGEMVPGEDGVYETYRWLGMTYVLVPDQELTNHVTLDVISPTVDNSVNVSFASMRRNYRTNIIGELLTTDAVFNVKIEPIYYDDYNEYQKAE